MQIRSETYKDYNALYALHYRAFGNRTLEPNIVTALRTRAEYDPELSLVAEENGQIVGHAFFSPYKVLFGAGSEEVAAVNLAPLAVEPAYQKKGVGATLVKAGHTLAQARGYRFSFLLGHPSYYPRLGYLPSAFGNSFLKVALADLEPANSNSFPDTLQARNVEASDILGLVNLWQKNEGQPDFSLVVGKTLADWVSPATQVKSVVYLRRDTGEVAAYVRYHLDKPLESIFFLAQSGEVAREVIRHVAKTAFSEQGQVPNELSQIRLPLHPASFLAGQDLFKKGEWEVQAWEAGMVYPLAPSPFDDYYNSLQKGAAQPGRVLWSVYFEFE